MAEENTNSTDSTNAAAETTAAKPKRKYTRRKATAATATTTTAGKATAGRKQAAARKTATTKKAAGKRQAAARKAQPDLAARAREASRNAFLASLGFYGKAFDQVQEQFNSVQSQLEARRKKADKLYVELVKRGEKVEKQARNAIDDIELPRIDFDSITDRKKLEAQLDKARERFSELKDSVRFKPAA